MGESQKSFACSFDNCEAAFRKPRKLEAHPCKHTGSKPFSCENCDRSFCTRQQLARHQLGHSGEEPHECLAVGSSEAFATNTSMKTHVAGVHRHREKRHECDLADCGKDFHKRNQLKAHKCDQHQQPPSFLCAFSGCARGFPSHGRLKHHEKTHNGYACEVDACSFKGKTWTEYMTHRKVHLVKVSCGNCDKSFNNTWVLHQHELRVHSGQPKRTFPCPRDGCNKRFNRRFNMESHVLGDHDGTKPFSCAYSGCDKSFAMKESLWRHGVVHDPAKKKLKALRPKKKRPQQVKPAAATDQQGTCDLVKKLHNMDLSPNAC